MGNEEGLDEGWNEGLSWLFGALSYCAFMFDNREKFLALYGQDMSTVVGQNDKHERVSRGSAQASRQELKTHRLLGRSSRGRH